MALWKFHVERSDTRSWDRTFKWDEADFTVIPGETAGTASVIEINSSIYGLVVTVIAPGETKAEAIEAAKAAIARDLPEDV